MKKIIELFNNLDKIDLKILKIGLKICFMVLITGVFLLFLYLLIHNLFFYELGMAVTKLSSYLTVEFVVCGIVADLVKKRKLTVNLKA